MALVQRIGHEQPQSRCGRCGHDAMVAQIPDQSLVFLALVHARDKRSRAAPVRARARSLTPAALCGYSQ